MTTSVLLLLLRDYWKDLICLIICIIARNDCYDVFDCFMYFYLFLEVSVSALPWYLTVNLLC